MFAERRHVGPIRLIASILLAIIAADGIVKALIRVVVVRTHGSCVEGELWNWYWIFRLRNVDARDGALRNFLPALVSQELLRTHALKAFIE